MCLYAFLASVLEWLIDVDTALTLAINNHFSPFFDAFMYDFSRKLVWIPFYASLLFIVVVNLKWRIALIACISIGIIFFVCNHLSAEYLRFIVERMRPSNPDNPISAQVHIVNNYRGGPFGFPSAHAANVFGLGVYIYLLLKNHQIGILMVLWSVLTAYSRIYLGVHYLGDVAVGAMLGTLIALAVYYLPTKWYKPQVPKRLNYTWLPMTVCALTVAIFAVTALYSV